MRHFQVAVPAGVAPESRIRAVDPVTQQEVELVMPDMPNANGTMLTVAVPEQPEEERPTSFSGKDCCRECWCFCGIYTLVVGIFATLAAFAGPLCFVCFALSPAGPIWAFIERWYRKYITRCTLFDVAGEACLLLIIPLMITITIIDYYLPIQTACGNDNSAPFWRYFFFAYIRAALLEEALKYFAVRRQLFKAYVIDARCLLVYAGWAGAVFGMLENIAYAFILPIGTVIVRCFLTVPLHASTGIQIGANLAGFRFVPGQQTPSSSLLPLEDDKNCLDAVRFHIRTFVVATWAPILLHGTYDVLLIILAGECATWMISLFFLALAGVVAQLWYIRYRVLQIQRRFPPDDRDVHSLIKDGSIPPPCPCCCCGDGCCECCY